MDDIYTFVLDNKPYVIRFLRDRKLKKSARFEMIEGKLTCRMSLFFVKSQAINYIEKNKATMVAIIKKASVITETDLYLFGIYVPIVSLQSKKYVEGLGTFSDESELKKLLKKTLLKYVNMRAKELESIMNISNPYRYSVKSMKTRYGSNSRKTHRIAISLNLVHYNHKMIDSVIVHELAHDKHFDHSKAFYSEVYRYCPDYKILRKKLIKGEFQ